MMVFTLLNYRFVFHVKRDHFELLPWFQSKKLKFIPVDFHGNSARDPSVEWYLYMYKLYTVLKFI